MHVLFDSSRWLVIAVVLLGGCTGGLAGHLPTWSFFAKEDNTTYVTPAKQIAKLQTLAEGAASKSAAEQERIAVELARQIRNEQDPLLREQIVRTAAHFTSPTADAVLGAALQDRDTLVRLAAIEAIAGRGGSDAVQALSRLVENEGDIDVRLAAARALGDLQDPATTEALVAALESPDPALQYRAMQSLKSTTGKDFGDDAEAWLQYARGETPQAKPYSFVDSLKKLQPF